MEIAGRIAFSNSCISMLWLMPSAWKFVILFYLIHDTGSDGTVYTVAILVRKMMTSMPRVIEKFTQQHRDERFESQQFFRFLRASWLTTTGERFKMNQKLLRRSCSFQHRGFDELWHGFLAFLSEFCKQHNETAINKMMKRLTKATAVIRNERRTFTSPERRENFRERKRIE